MIKPKHLGYWLAPEFIRGFQWTRLQSSLTFSRSVAIHRIHGERQVEQRSPRRGVVLRIHGFVIGAYVEREGKYFIRESEAFTSLALAVDEPVTVDAVAGNSDRSTDAEAREIL